MRWSLRRTLAICSHISGDTESAANKQQLCQCNAQAARCSRPPLLCVCTHSPLLFFSCLFSASLQAPPSRSDAASVRTAPCPSSAAPLAAAWSSAPPCARDWREGGACVHVAAPPSYSARVVSLLPPCAAVTLLSRPTADARSALCCLRQPHHGAQRVQRRNESCCEECTRGGCCASLLEEAASLLRALQGRVEEWQRRRRFCARPKTQLSAPSAGIRERKEKS